MSDDRVVDAQEEITTQWYGRKGILSFGMALDAEETVVAVYFDPTQIAASEIPTQASNGVRVVGKAAQQAVPQAEPKSAEEREKAITNWVQSAEGQRAIIEADQRAKASSERFHRSANPDPNDPEWQRLLHTPIGPKTVPRR